VDPNETSTRSFQRRLNVGLAVLSAIAIVMAGVASGTLYWVIRAHEDVQVHSGNVEDALRLEAAAAEQAADIRAYLFSRDPVFLEEAARDQAVFHEHLGGIRERGSGSTAFGDNLQRVEEAARQRDAAADELLASAEAGVANDQLVQEFLQGRYRTLRLEVDRSVHDLVADETRMRDQRELDTRRSSQAALAAMIALTALVCVLAIAAATTLARSLGRDVGAVSTPLQSASAELQAAAAQQASTSTEQATAMAEIGTTIRELQATSRQIAESAQQVAAMAREVQTAADRGEQAVQQARSASSEARTQTDEVVRHMLDLGQRAQQIGAIVDLVNELAEQTNIVAFNAALEAAGSESGNARFGVVADEMRRLADRLGVSAREVRTLVEEVQSAANTTVMATEANAKAVELNARRFDELSGSFTRILDLVNSTSSAAREIELSTGQQNTAMDQVTGAILGATQASRETETSTKQTLQTASQLADLARQLGRIVGLAEPA
jgi:CHASE3 domain sensor protein